MTLEGKYIELYCKNCLRFDQTFYCDDDECPYIYYCNDLKPYRYLRR